ncbi:MAG: hypothetical protein IKW10_06640 [Oscillospiraceae bacterium]|nr:hypothetical protein [Oscillospiraceae bacterium]
MDKLKLLSRQNGTLPDRYWYQLNSKSPLENYIEQKQSMLDADTDELIIRSEVVVK